MREAGTAAGEIERGAKVNALDERTEDVRSRLEDIASELDDLIFGLLREAADSEDRQALADGKRLAKARRAVLRAAAALADDRLAD